MTQPCAAPPDLAEAPVPSEAEGLALPTPGAYLKLRREAQGFTIQHVVLTLVPPTRKSAAEDRADLRNRIALAEADALYRTAIPGLLDKLDKVFAFDPGIYWALTVRMIDPERPIRVPRLCRGCGCSQHDACLEPIRAAGAHDRPCAWSAADPGLCTACEQKAALAAAKGVTPAKAGAQPAKEAEHA